MQTRGGYDFKTGIRKKSGKDGVNTWITKLKYAVSKSGQTAYLSFIKTWAALQQHPKMSARAYSEAANQHSEKRQTNLTLFYQPGHSAAHLRESHLMRKGNTLTRQPEPGHSAFKRTLREGVTGAFALDPVAGSAQGCAQAKKGLSRS